MSRKLAWEIARTDPTNRPARVRWDVIAATGPAYLVGRYVTADVSQAASGPALRFDPLGELLAALLQKVPLGIAAVWLFARSAHPAGGRQS